MSKKNKLKTRQNAHAIAVQKDKEARAAKADKVSKSQAKLRTNSGVAKKQAAKRQRRGLRIQKGVVIRGVKVKDSDSKKKVRELLRAEAEATMAIDSDDDGWEEVGDEERAAMQM